MADQLLPGYPVPLGGRQMAILQHAGPSDYVSGGETFDARHLFGGGVIDRVDGGLSFNSTVKGTYQVRALYPVGQAANGATGSTDVKLQWTFAANGAEPANNTDLSAQYARLSVIGG